MNGVIVWQTRNYKLSQALGRILIVLFVWQGAVEQKTLSKIQVFGSNDWSEASFYIEHVCYKGSRQKTLSLDKVLKVGS